ncbi:MAG: hypothetical protein LBR44_03360 [Clostridiales Family XIII bacterium]|nr:hypothetical protein [Clostridiales Family XIII bacterium]
MIDIKCDQCGADEYQLLDPKTGEVRCAYCRNRWIVPELIVKTETEKFLEEQSKRPVVVQDNSTETDQELMRMVSGLAAGGLAGCNPFARIGYAIRRFFRTLAIVVIIAVVAILLYKFVDWQAVFSSFK